MEIKHKVSLVPLCMALAFLAGSAGVRADQTFIGMTPTEFTEGFNRAAQVYRLKPRLPQWPTKAGKFAATVAPGITVSGVGVSSGDGMSSITVSCKSDAQCSDAIFAAALSADPELEIASIKDYMQRTLNGELEDGAYMSQAGLAYTLVAKKAQKSLTLTITVDPDEDE